MACGRAVADLLLCMRAGCSTTAAAVAKVGKSHSRLMLKVFSSLLADRSLEEAEGMSAGVSEPVEWER